MSDLANYVVAALGGGGVVAIVQAMLRRDERLALAYLADAARQRAELWTKIARLEKMVEEQDAQITKVIQTSSVIYDSVESIKASIRPPPVPK